jgi:hypothetical protein
MDIDFRSKDLRQPRIERGAHRWQRWILPLLIPSAFRKVASGQFR